LEPQAGVGGAADVKAPDPDASDKATSGEEGAIATANSATESAVGQFEIPARNCRMRSPCQIVRKVSALADRPHIDGDCVDNVISCAS
jgi:hypothetical protein